MKQLFFIVGSGRCGSTYLMNLLNRHPRVALTNESAFIDLTARCLELATLPVGVKSETLGATGFVNPDYHDALRSLFHRHVRNFVEAFFRECFPDKDFTHWGDKLPSVLSFARTLHYYPKAKAVILVRDPRDVLCSYTSWVKRGLENDPAAEWRPDWWADTYAGFLDKAPDRHILRYEDLLEDAQAEVAKIIDFLGLEATSDIAAESLQALFAGHGTSDTPRASVGRWKAELSPADIELVESSCGELMTTFGYPLAGAAGS